MHVCKRARVHIQLVLVCAQMRKGYQLHIHAPPPRVRPSTVNKEYSRPALAGGLMNTFAFVSAFESLKLPFSSNIY